MSCWCRFDQVHEVLRRANRAGGRKIACGLVAPRAVERMLHDGHQFHVREAHLLHIVGQPRSHLPVGERAVAFFGERIHEPRWTS